MQGIQKQIYENSWLWPLILNRGDGKLFPTFSFRNQCSTLVRTLMYGRCDKLMEEGRFRPWGCETPEPIHLKFGVSNYVHSPTPHVKYGGRRGGKMGWGDG